MAEIKITDPTAQLISSTFTFGRVVKNRGLNPIVSEKRNDRYDIVRYRC